MFEIIMMQQIDPIVKEGVSTFERIENPILVLLIVVLILGIIFMYKYFTKLAVTLQTTIAQKDEKITGLNNVLIEVRSSDAAMIVEFKNTLEKFVDTDTEYSDKLGDNNDLLQQLIIKIDVLLKIIGK